MWAILAKDNAEAVIGSMVGWVSTNMGWYYFLIVTAVVAFVLVTALSRVGKTKLGPDHSKPQFGMFTWAAMLFAAGIGIDLMFFSVSEPVSQYLAPPQGEGGNAEAARQALVWTLFHYGITGWALYALMGLAPGLLRLPAQPAAEHPLRAVPDLWQADRRPVGHAVDIAALLGTIFGIATSLGIGVVQLNYGLNFMFGIPENLAVQIGLIAAVRGDGHRLRGLRRGEGHPAAVRAQRDPGRRPDALRPGRRQDQLPARRHRAEHRRRHQPLPRP